MLPRLGQSSALALISALALSACAGGVAPTLPNTAGVSQSAAMSVGAGALCPARFVACVTVSQKNGAEFIWCYGPSTNPCNKSEAGKVKWSGVVCLAKGLTCKNAIKQLTAKWTGPFKCKAKDKCTGTFELDTIKPGAGLKQIKKYYYKQDIHICSGASCEDEYIGINVGS
jgi:hypothetical protein